MPQKKGGPKIILHVDKEFKEKYKKHWQSQGYMYESEYTRKLLRDDMRKGKEDKE